MINSDFIDDYLGSVSRLSEVVGANLCIATAGAEVLCQRPGGLPVAELADAGTARSAAAAMALHDSPRDRADSPACVIRPGADPHTLLILISTASAKHLPSRSSRERRSYAGNDLLSSDAWLLLGLRFGDTRALPVFDLRRALQPQCPVDWLLNFIVSAGLAVVASWEMSRALHHTISNLPGRVEFEQSLVRLAEKFKQRHEPLSLIFINPDHFEQINHRFGRPEGDGAIREIASLLRAVLRESDLLFHYSGAIFAIALPATDTAGARAIAEKIRARFAASYFVNGVLRMTISIGGSTNDADGQAPLDAAELVRRADSALNIAKLGGGAIIEFWHADGRVPLIATRGTGNVLFTADAIKDYRNMGMLWDLMSALTVEREVAAIGRAVTGRVAQGFKSATVALYSFDPDASAEGRAGSDRPTLVAASEWQAATENVSALLAPPDMADIGALMQQAIGLRDVASVSSADQICRCVVPLIVREMMLGCLYIDSGTSQELDKKDLVFLRALMSQIAVSLDRADLLEKWLAKTAHERKQLRVEVRELRRAVGQSKLIYQSEEMQRVMQTVQKIAGTDATVLITGESGTGKEILGHAVHDLSGRFDKPFITVDCGAISPNLIEAELFGRVKGAFTGADSATSGYIRQAHGGTLFLDEIGELPIDVQARLLRFVQEKTVTAVGASVSQQLDVRIIAATNRDLLEEVRTGGFRSDLFYRLQVMTLTPPPLRSHAADVLPLAYHFLEKFCLQYQKRGLYLSSEAKVALQGYDWPGNVRELQHTMLRAVLLADSPTIGTAELNLPQARRTPDLIADATWSAADCKDATGDQTRPDLWQSLGRVLRLEVNAMLDQQPPVGRWLTEEFLLAANTQAAGGIRQAAELLGQAESTFRRQLVKAQRLRRLGGGPKNPGWENVAKIVLQLVQVRTHGGEGDTGNLVLRSREILLAVVSAATEGRLSCGAALMDVSTPTYKNWLSQ